MDLAAERARENWKGLVIRDRSSGDFFRLEIERCSRKVSLTPRREFLSSLNVYLKYG